MPAWTPISTGSTFTLPPTLAPLESLRASLNVLSGLASHGADAQGDGPGDHARSSAALLTARHPVKSEGDNLDVGPSIDQQLAKVIGKHTRFPSLELGIETSGSGTCDSGYACAYSQNISWSAPQTPATKETNPKFLFDRLFANSHSGESEEQRQRRLLYKKSILDFVKQDATELKAKLGNEDQKKLDEYLSSVRELEIRVTQPNTCGAQMGTIPSGRLEYPDHLKLMCDLMIAAMKCDQTRIISMMFANEGSNRSYPFAGVSGGHHSLSHHMNNAETQAQIAIINHWHILQLKYLATQMKATPDGESNLLDDSLLFYGSGISDGNIHNHDELPILLLGGSATNIKSGQHLRFANGTPLSNLFLNISDAVGAPLAQFGDSTGRLTGLSL